MTSDGWGVSNDEWEKGKTKREKEQAVVVKLLKKERKIEEKKLRAGLEERLRIEIKSWDEKFAGGTGMYDRWQLGPKPDEDIVNAKIEREVNNLLRAQIAFYGDW